MDLRQSPAFRGGEWVPVGERFSRTLSNKLVETGLRVTGIIPYMHYYSSQGPNVKVLEDHAPCDHGGVGVGGRECIMDNCDTLNGPAVVPPAAWYCRSGQ
jgi:hypothetical protein